MAYDAKVIEVMIASPSDVSRERMIAREAILQWNSENSKRLHAALLPVMWETHASPVMGERAQAIINKEVLRDCDLLVGIFWTRIGTPTGDSPSGTLEEIREHVALGKPAMVYFSFAPIVPESVDPKQYEQLKEFREQCKKEGLIETYSDPQDFEKKFPHQLALRVSNDPYLQKLLSKSDEYTYEGTALHHAPPSPAPMVPTLSKEARELLIEASDDPHGAIMMVRFIGGMAIQTNRKQFGVEGDRRSQATWEAAVMELRNEGLIQDRGYKGEYFELTHQGFQMADLLKHERPKA